MKKIILGVLVFMMLMPLEAVFANTEITSTKEVIRRRQLIQNVGYKLLNANRIDKRMIFAYAHNKKEANAYACGRYRTITVTKGMMDNIDSEDELAAVIGHEISHQLDHYKGIFKGYFSFTVFKPQARREEIKADLRSIDFLVNAGYNPVASIIIFNKMLNQPRYEWYLSHPLGSRRLAKAYEYIYVKYPYFLVNNEYIKNPVYQNFLLTSKENRLKLKDALEEAKTENKPLKQPKYN